MRPARLYQLFTSVKTTAALLAVLAVFLFLGIVVPQESLLGEEAFAELAGQSAVSRFFLVTLRLGFLSTSPVFLVVLGVFYLNLALVLARRVRPTLGKLRVRRRPEAGLRAWAETGGALVAPLPEGFQVAALVDTLRGFGYRVERAGERAFWGLKHRTAALGFLLFHLSFFLLFGGGALLYATRFVGMARLIEGQEFTGEYAVIARRPPLGAPPELRFSVEEVDPVFESGEPVHLAATFRFLPSGIQRPARVNHPAEWGAASILVQFAGVAPVFWLQDEAGFTREHLAAAVTTRTEGATFLDLDGGRYLLAVEPPAVDRPFPRREDLESLPIELTVVRQGNREAGEPAETVFEGSLRPGEAADLGGDRLVLSELRYWVGFQVVSERGGALLIAGFAVGILGLVWRLMLYRREVAVVWDDETLRLVGHSEYFPERFRDELEAIFSTLLGSSQVGRQPISS